MIGEKSAMAAVNLHNKFFWTLLALLRCGLRIWVALFTVIVEERFPAHLIRLMVLLFLSRVINVRQSVATANENIKYHSDIAMEKVLQRIARIKRVAVHNAF